MLPKRVMVEADLPVDEASAVALLLASPDAGFITGELLNVNDGRIFER